MKKAWLLVLSLVLVAGAAAVADRMSGPGKNSPVFGMSQPEAKGGRNGTSGEASSPGGSGAMEISKRGPGLKPRTIDTLHLPVPRTFDLAHVQPEYFATALGKDPARIFEFVRDQIGYESYEGCLRGPRGTLLAMAGNAVDRASLLASMLQHAGQRVRFAHGTLPEPLGRELVTSMWAERPRPAPAKAAIQPSPAMKRAMETLISSIKGDYTLIRDQLKKANLALPRDSAPSLDSLVKETQKHYWVQWWKNGAWVDLDPSFSDSSPGGKYASAEQTFDTLPEALFHQVEIRIRLEEYTGDQVSSRVILTRRARAADLSAVDVVLSHQPENWNGPAASLPAALAGGITATGRIKPVLLIGNKDWVAGEPFYPKSPPTGGMGGVFNALAGIGTRKEAPIATAEALEFEFTAPAGRKETVVRQVIDLVGSARRAVGRRLSAEEVRSRADAPSAPDLTKAAYDVFFTTGELAATQLREVGYKDLAHGDSLNMRAGLREINVSFTAASDLLLRRIGQPERALIVFYPDSPRVQITDIATLNGNPRLSLDLRRDHRRAVAMGPHSEEVFWGCVLRGVVDGALERTVGDLLIAGTGDKNWRAGMSTSSLLERARASNVPIVTLRGNRSSVVDGLPEDAGARIRGELSDGYLIVSPRQAVPYADQQRFAWWRIDSRTGELLATTDEGLNQDTVEYNITRGEQLGTNEVDVFVNNNYLGSRTFSRFGNGVQELADYIRFLESEFGATQADPEWAAAEKLFSGIF